MNNRASFKQRALAYLLDFILLGLFTYALTLVVPQSETLKNTNTALENLNESYLNGKITYDEFVKAYLPLNQTFDKENMIINISNLSFIIVYFILYPFYHEGQTLGKKVMHLKVIKKNGFLTVRTLVFRNFFTTSLFTLMLGSATVYFLPANIYFYLISFFSFIQFLLVILSCFMILYRKDKRAVHDCILKTAVIVE